MKTRCSHCLVVAEIRARSRRMKARMVAMSVILMACSKPAPEASKPAATIQESSGGPAPHVSVAPMYAPPGTAVAGSSGVVTPTGEAALAWDMPSTWSSQPNPNTMRKATYKIPRGPSDAEDAECAVSQAGGALDDNIKRWEQQFEGGPTAKRTERKIAGLTVTIVEIQGTFLGSGMGPAGTAKKAGTTMLAAIVATEPAHFFKLVGPTNTVSLAKPDFDKLLNSIKKK